MAFLIIRSSRAEHLYTAVAELSSLASEELNIILTTNAALDTEFLEKALPGLRLVAVESLRIGSVAEKEELKKVDIERVLVLDNQQGGYAYLPIFRLANGLAPEAELVVHSSKGVSSYASPAIAIRSCYTLGTLDYIKEALEFVLLTPAWATLRVVNSLLARSSR